MENPIIARGESPLGNNCEILPHLPQDNGREHRALLYETQDDIIKILPANHRTTQCLRVSIGNVKVMKDQAHQKAFYGGLVTCGSVWACPVCSAKIQARRSEEVCKAVAYAYNNNMKVAMVTLTHPHTLGDDINENLGKMKQALVYFRKGRSFDLMKKRVGMKGIIRGLEVTYGGNGWHIHTHELWLMDNKADVSELAEYLKKRWVASCIKAGFDETKAAAMFEHGCDVMDNCHASDYLAKFGQHWGIDKEMSKGSSKKAKSQGGKTPFDLAHSDDSRDKALFLQYALAFHGKRQLLWSQGLKALVGVAEKTDQELAEEQKEQADILALLDRDAWKIVRMNKARSVILDIAETQGFNGLVEWFADFGYPLRPPDV